MPVLNHPVAAENQLSQRALVSRRFTCALLLAITLPVGLLWRFGPYHLPPFAFKYGGSMLWAMGIYWFVGILFARKQPRFLAILAGTIAVCVELFKLVPSVRIDEFRETFAGKVLLGRYFTFGAIVAYLLAIAAVALLDQRVRFGRPRPQNPAIH